MLKEETLQHFLKVMYGKRSLNVYDHRAAVFTTQGDEFVKTKSMGRPGSQGQAGCLLRSGTHCYATHQLWQVLDDEREKMKEFADNPYFLPAWIF